MLCELALFCPDTTTALQIPGLSLSVCLSVCLPTLSVFHICYIRQCRIWFKIVSKSQRYNLLCLR